MTGRDPGVPRFVLFLLNQAIRLYPCVFRAAFADEIRETFQDEHRRRSRDARGFRRFAALLDLAVRSLLSVSAAALAERRHSSMVRHPRKSDAPQPNGDNAIAAVAGDIQYAFRSLRKQPGFALVAVATIGVGIGANTALFSLVNGVLYRALPFEEPERLVTAWTSNLARGVNRWGVSLHDYTDWRERSDVFADLGAYNRNMTNVGGLERPRRIVYAQVTPGVFPTLGIPAQYGRTFTEDENLPGNDAVLVVSHGFWSNHLGRDPGAVGNTLIVDGRPMTVVGVMPEGFGFPDPGVEVWKPFGMVPADEGGRGGRWVRAIGRLREGVELEQARASLGALGSVLEAEFPESNRGFGIYIEPMLTTAIVGVRQTLIVLWATGGLVLLIAASNIANLLLARATSREREMAVRAALGATRGRLVRQLLAESVPLALLGGAVGVGLAYLGIRVLPGLSGTRIPRLDEVSIDRVVLAYSVGVSLLMGVLFTILPARRASRAELTPSLREGSKGSQGRERSGARSGLVVAQVTLAVVAVTGAGLLLRSFVALLETDPGFVEENVLSIRIAPSWKEIPERTVVAGIYDDIRTELTAVPGVQTVSATNVLPLAGNRWGTVIEIEGKPVTSVEERRSALTRVVLAGYHATMGIPVLQGRELRGADDASAQRVVVINETAAAAWWSDEDPVGRRLRLLGAEEWRTVVGVVGDVSHSQLSVPTRPMIYVAFAQGRFGHFQDWGMTFVVRTRGEPGEVTDALRMRMAAVAPSIPLYDIATLEDVIWNDISGERFVMTVLATFAGVALLLAAVGVYSVMSYLVTQRTREIGVRVALGAARGSVVGMVVKKGLGLTAVGLAIGMFASALAGRLLSGMLYKTTILDPVTHFGVVLVLVTAATTASLLPAVRAARTDPLTALRAE